MNNQFRQRRRNQRWRINRQIKDRRRLNVFLVEKRVRQLEGWREVVLLDLDNTHDLMTALERKVQQLLAENKQYQTRLQQMEQPAPPRSVWQRLITLLRTKGNP